jgi:hypothetical protein
MAGAYSAAMKAEADTLGVACLDVHGAMLGVDGGEDTWSVFLGAKDSKVINAQKSKAAILPEFSHALSTIQRSFFSIIID